MNKKEKTYDSLDKELQRLKEVTINQDANLTCWPPNEGEFIIGLFTDGYYPREVIKVQGEYIEVDFLVQVSIAQVKKDSSLWKRPSIDRSERHKVHLNRFSNARQNDRYYQIFTGHFKNPSDIGVFGFSSSSAPNLSTC